MIQDNRATSHKNRQEIAHVFCPGSQKHETVHVLHSMLHCYIGIYCKVVCAFR